MTQILPLEDVLVNYFPFSSVSLSIRKIFSITKDILANMFHYRSKEQIFSAKLLNEANIFDYGAVLLIVVQSLGIIRLRLTPLLI